MPEASATLSEISLKKLTVLQLRALCKEKGITGYGKIPKDSVIAKLLQWQQSRSSPRSVADAAPTHSVPSLVIHSTLSPGISPQTAGSANSDPTQSLSRRGGKNAQQSWHVALPQDLQGAVNSTTSKMADAAQQPPNPGSTLQIAVNDLTSLSATYNTPSAPEVLPTSKTTSNKRLPTELQTLHEDSNKRFKLDIPRQQPHIIPKEPIRQEIFASKHRGETVSGLVHIRKRRFMPLVPTTAPPQQAGHSKDRTRDTTLSSSVEEIHQYLDFQMSSFNSPLKTLLHPPSLSQRKRVPQLALILSEISYEDLKSCATVSRSFRYAAFLAATRHLLRHFPGKRTDEVLAQYPKDRTNFWPYLLYRQREAESRRRIYEESFMGFALKGAYTIKRELWGSPSHERQATVAVRSLLTKLYFDISVGGEVGRTVQKVKCGTVLDAEQVVPNQVWKIAFSSEKSVQVFYILEPTCEVIGQAEISGKVAPNTNLRADWFQFIATRSSANAESECPHELWNKINWTNHEEYDRGLSKHWLSRVAKEGALGQAKAEVARRYIFACVVSNSVSGTWQSSTEMCQDFNGSRKSGPTTIHKEQRVNLFLPAHHHVESVHFNLGKGGALHPALAVVQTPSREYYVFKDNGMQVGCEEDGIAPIWKQILGLEMQ